MYKQIPKIKDFLEKNGELKNTSLDSFGRCLMVLFGMKRETAKKWIRYFEENKVIKVNGDKVKFL